MQKKRDGVYRLVVAAMVAALYTVLTYLASAMNLAYGPVQFRFSEALTLLPVLTPFAIPGLAVGCFFSNMMSTLGMVDMVFGTTATLLAAICTYLVRNVRIKGVPFLAPLMPVLWNTVVIGAEIACLSDAGGFSLANFSWQVFLASALSVGLGELVICYGLGLPLVLLLERSGAAKTLFPDTAR